MARIRFSYSLLICCATLLFANEYEEGLNQYQDGNYTEAARLFSVSAETGNPYAQYALAQMYESGKGVERNATQAIEWYKRSASVYRTPSIDSSSEQVVQQAHLYQIDPQSDAERRKYILENLPMPKDVDERETILTKIFGNFGMLPYDKTFLIPLAYTTENYEQRDPISYPGYNEFNNNIETEFQISLKKKLTYNLLGLNEEFGFGYTQEVWWQFYSDSAPFRETNYRPEIWVLWPVQDKKYADTGLKAFKIAFWHESNGLGEPLSREWNQVYLDTIFFYRNLIATLRVWYPDAGEHNKDITDYLGYGHLKLNYILGKHQFDLTWRNNLHFDGDNRGSVEGEWSYPIGHSKNNFWYFKAFSGYGASLMDYNHHQNRFGFGFLFSR